MMLSELIPEGDTVGASIQLFGYLVADTNLKPEKILF